MAATPSFLKPQDINLALKLLRKNWWIVLCALTLTVGIKYYQWYKKPVVYRVATDILYKPEKDKSSADPYSRYMQQSASREQKNNQERILKSYDLVANVIDKLDFEQSYFLVGRIKTTETYSKQFKLAVKNVSPKYNSTRFIVSFLPQNINLHLFKTNGEELIKTFPIGNILRDNEVEIELLPLGGSFASLAQRLENSSIEIKINSKASLVNKYRSKISLNQLESTSIFNIAITEQAAEKAKIFLDTLIQLYQDFSVKDRLKQNEKTTEFIDNQLELIANIINRNEFELERYKKQESIFDISKEESRYYELFLKLEDEIKTAEFKIKTLERLKEYIAQQKEGSKLLPPLDFVPDDTFLTTAIQELYEMEKERSSDLFEVRSENPLLSRKDSAYRVLKKDLFRYIDNSIAYINDRKLEAIKKQKSYETQLRSLPQSQREIVNISRKIQVNEKLYNFLLERRATNIIDRSSIGGDIEVVDRPRQTGTVTQSKASFIKSGVILGLIIALLIGAVRFFFFDTVENLEELKHNFSGIVAGGLPTFDNIRMPTDIGYLESDQSEAFRRLRTNLQFLGLKKDQPQVILTTSMFPSEGKTFTSTNLAFLFGFSGKKVLLIDVDLHKPRVHKALNVDNSKGISLVLSGNETLQSQVQEFTEGVDVLASGPIPPNASELILNGGLQEIINEVKTHYDIVFIDTPPLHLITDAHVLMDISDVNLLVLNTRKASRTTIKDIEEVFNKPVKGTSAVILNEIRTTKIGRYLGKYNYKYAYRYGYGAYSYKNHKS